MLFALVGSIFTFLLFLKTKTPIRWARVIGFFALAYIAAFYAFGLSQGNVPAVEFFRPAFTGHL